MKIGDIRRILRHLACGFLALGLCAPANAGPVTLKHLPGALRGFRLAGESDSSEWPVFLTAREAASNLRFQIGYLAAISVMPEISTLTVFVNDVAIGSTHIRAGSGRVATFNVPSGLAKPGVNSIRISALERHRVDCSVRATYELWTQIDSDRTGLVVPSGDLGIRDLDDLPTLSPDGEGAMPIRLIMPSPASPHSVESAIHAVEAVALAGRFEQPLVDIGPAASGPYGLNLVVAPRNQLASLGVATGLEPESGPQIAVLPAQSGGRPTVVVTGANETDLDAAIGELESRQPIEGAAAGLRALRDVPGLRVRGRESVTLGALGAQSEEFSGRLFRTGFDVTMPADFYPADYGKVFVDFYGGYAAGLAPGSEILIKVNERDAANLRLADRSGAFLKAERIPIELGALRPGVNRIDIEAHVPIPADRACDPLATVSGAERFLFLNSTRIEIPSIARIARVPDLAVTATGAFVTAHGKAPILWMPVPDRASVASAASLAAQFARVAGHIVPFKLSLDRPNPREGSVLVVGPSNSLPSGLAAAAGLDPARLAMWSRSADRANPVDVGAPSAAAHIKSLDADSPAACHDAAWTFHPHEVESAFYSDEGGSALDDADLGRKWRAQIGDDENPMHWVGQALAQADHAVGWTIGRILSTGGARDYSQLKKDPHASLIVGQTLQGTNADSLWTFVTAPNSADIAAAMGCLVDPRVWRQLSGQLTFIDASTGRTASIASVRTHLIATQPLSIQNGRLIAAGWMSLNPSAFVLLALIAALCLAASTLWFVKNVGRSQ